MPRASFRLWYTWHRGGLVWNLA